MMVAGVDGCPGGWLVVSVEAARRLSIQRVSIVPNFQALIDATMGCAAVGVDIPIGLSDGPDRPPDFEARKLLGPPRASSVYPAPIRQILYAGSYQEACDISASVRGKKISKQTYMIIPKIREADQAMTRDLQGRIVEVHPEVCFWKLNARQPMPHAKRKAEGAAARLALLSQAFADDIAALQAPRGAARDDLYDACAAAWTAGRVAHGSAQRLPPEPPADRRGLRMEIVY